MLTMACFVNLSKHEADISVSIERPLSGNYVVTKLSDYVLKLYASREYLARHAPIHTMDDLAQHNFIGYIDDLVFSEELRYKDTVAPDAFRAFRSTSVVAQYTAACAGRALAILPCFLSQQSDELVPVLPGQIAITRTFWLVASSEQRHVARVSALWSYLRDCVELNRDFLMGQSRRMRWLE